MFRTIFEHRYGLRTRYLLPFARRVNSRKSALVGAAIAALLLGLAAIHAPRSARANLALCLKSLPKDPAANGSPDFRGSASRAIERCIAL
jgi:hypothetical protein